MTAQAHSDSKALSVLCVCLAVGISSASDALVKWMSGSYPVHEILFIRCLVGFPILAAIVHRRASFRAMFAPGWQWSAIRGTIMASSYLAFVLSIAAMPMAATVAIYFVMPLIVALLAWPLLGERVRPHRWLAIIAGFAGVTTMIDPGRGMLEPAGLLALYSAFGYALSQSLARRILRTVPPAMMAFHANAIYWVMASVLALAFMGADFGAAGHKSLAFLARPWILPSTADLIGLGLLGATVAVAMVLFATAYKYAESSFVAPFEYTAMFWAAAYGFMVFGDIPGARTLWGGAIVLVAGLFMLHMDRRLAPAPLRV